MMRLTCLFLIFIACSCSSENNVPDGILPPAKMETILDDLMRADEYLTNHLLRDTSIKRDSMSKIFYQKVFQLHKVSKETFKSSMNYYEMHPDLLKPVLDSLEARRQTPINPPPFIEQDSVNTLSPKKLQAY